MNPRTTYLVLIVLVAVQGCVINGRPTPKFHYERATSGVPANESTAVANTAQTATTPPAPAVTPVAPAPTVAYQAPPPPALTVPRYAPPAPATQLPQPPNFLGMPGTGRAAPQVQPVQDLGRFVIFSPGIEAYDQYAVRITNRTGSFVCVESPTDGYGAPMFRKRLGFRHVQTWLTRQDLPSLPCPAAIPPGGIANLAVEGGYSRIPLTVKFYSYTPRPRFERELVESYTFPYEFPLVDDPCTQASRRCIYQTELK